MVDQSKPLFSGDNSGHMWKAVWEAKSNKDLLDALYLVCCQIQMLEERFEKRWVSRGRAVEGGMDAVRSCQMKCIVGKPGQGEAVETQQGEGPFEVWGDLKGYYTLMFTPDNKTISNKMSKVEAEGFCRQLNECWAFSEET